MDKGSRVTISILLRTDMKCRFDKTRLFAYSSGLLASVPVSMNKQ